jgi:hypothetical protein
VPFLDGENGFREQMPTAPDDQGNTDNQSQDNDQNNRVNQGGSAATKTKKGNARKERLAQRINCPTVGRLFAR